MRKERHSKILEIIEKTPITTQEELLNELEKSEIPVTQATISRDIKYLRLVKTLDRNGIYRYTIMQGTADEEISKKFVSLFRETVISIETVENFICIKCFSGMAKAISTTLEAMNFRNVVGSIAGNDTIFIMTKSGDSAQELELMIHQHLENKK